MKETDISEDLQDADDSDLEDLENLEEFFSDDLESPSINTRSGI